MATAAVGAAQVSLPYFAMYPTDYEAKTSHLSLEEDGAYNRLLRLMWMTPGCSLPDDPAWIARRMRIDAGAFDRVVAPLIAEFMKRIGGRVISPRLREEYEKADETYKLRSLAGKKGGRPKVIDNKANDTKAGLSRAKAGPKQPEPEPEEEREAIASPKKTRGSRISATWFLPKDWGVWATGEGMDDLSVRREADRFADYWRGVAGAKGVKLDWQATWRNWVRKSLADGRTARPRSDPRPGDQRTAKDGSIRELTAMGEWVEVRQ